MKLGRYPAVSLAVARQRAKEALDKLDQGLDPRIDYEAEKLAQEAQARAVRARSQAPPVSMRSTS